MILGHERQQKFFNEVIKNGTLAHAYLLHGPRCVGKFKVAQSIVKQLFCAVAREGKSCECLSCKNIENFSHPNVIFLDTQRTLVSKKEKRKEIPIEDIRELRRIFSLSSRNVWRVAIIDEAEKLSQEAANAFLKTLEEPGSNTLFLFIAESKEFIPATIVSRTQPVFFSLVPQTILEKFLQSKESSAVRREALLSLAYGRPGLLVAYLSDQSLFERDVMLKSGLEKILKGNIPTIFKLSEKYSQDPQEARKVAENVVRLVRECLIRDMDSQSVQRLKQMYRISELMETTNVNPRLALDALLLAASF